MIKVQPFKFCLASFVMLDFMPFSSVSKCNCGQILDDFNYQLLTCKTGGGGPVLIYAQLNHMSALSV